MNDQSGSAAAARIVDRGYQHYSGARLGRLHATWAMLRAGLARGMGIRRPFTAKILPWTLVFLAHFPVVVTLAVHALNSNTTSSLPSYAQLASGGFALLYFLFAAVVGPDLFCGDRRDRVLSLYFASPITRLHYVVARVSALALLLLALTLTPMLCLFVGNALLAPSAADFVRDNVRTLGHVLFAGVLLSLYCAALASAMSSLTDRRVYAGGALIGLLLVTSLVGSVLGQGIQFTGHDKFVLLDLLNLGARVTRWLFGQTPLTPNNVPDCPGGLRH